MINHVRTLLLNRDAATRPGYDYIGEEYVPPSFKARSVPSPLLTIRRALFGATPDRAMLNYRLRQLLCLIHSSELAEFIYARDTRITYWPFDDSVLRTVSRGPVVTQVAGENKTLYVLQPAVSTESSGRLQQQWRIEVVDGATVEVQTYDNDGSVLVVTQSYVTTDGLSSVLVLPNSSLRYRFQSGVGSAWLVEVLARPSTGLATVVNNVWAVLTESTREVLFGASAVEPYRTFQNLWDLHDEPVQRLGALTLALAYRTDEVK